MNKTKKTFFIGIIVFLGILIFLSNTTLTHASAPAQQDFYNDTECTSPKGVITIRAITCIIQNLIKPLPSIIALGAFAMLLIGGVKIMTSGGDAKAYASGMQTVTWAIIGLILLSVVWLILVTIEKLTGANVTNFGIPLNP